MWGKQHTPYWGKVAIEGFDAWTKFSKGSLSKVGVLFLFFKEGEEEGSGGRGQFLFAFKFLWMQ